MSRKILLYGDLDLNVVDGSSIWLINLAKLLLTDRDNYVDILLKKKIHSHILTGELEKRYRIRFLYAKEYLDHIIEVDENNIEKVLETIDSLRDYSCMILRGRKVTERLLNSPLLSKVIPYLTDFCHDKDAITDREKQFLKHLYEGVKAYFVQTDAMKEYLKEVLLVDGEKFHVLHPVVLLGVKGGKTPKKQKKAIIYAGKLAKDWNIWELLEMMDGLWKRDPEIKLHFVGNKVNQDLWEYKKEIMDKLEQCPNIIFHGALPHRETHKLMEECSLGYGFRSCKVDHENSLEISVKLLEYCFADVPVILRRTRMHQGLLGEDYPFYANSMEECLEKILLAVENDEIWEKARSRLEWVRERFAPEKIYGCLREAVIQYPEKKMRLLVSGHDLKFLKPLFPYFEQEFSLEVQELTEYMEFSPKEAKKYLKRADIIWCEWLLASAQWYSNHAYPHQSLFIRAHRFEVGRAYGRQLDLRRVTKVITVSYYWMEEFTRRFGIPPEKCTVINNFIEVDKYSKEKSEDARYHLTLAGALPKRKGLHRAVELLGLLRKRDDRYVLHVTGKRPEEFPNTWNVPEEKEYYMNVYEMIEREGLSEAVVFEGWVDMHQFLARTGYVLSLSDSSFPESFHVTPFESMAAAGAALALRWEGIEYIYPEETVADSVEKLAERIEDLNRHEEDYQKFVEQGLQFVTKHYDMPIIWEEIRRLLKTGGDYEEFCDSYGKGTSYIIS